MPKRFGITSTDELAAAFRSVQHIIGSEPNASPSTLEVGPFSAPRTKNPKGIGLDLRGPVARAQWPREKGDDPV